MKYFSISSVVEAYNKVSVSTKEKFWGILGILHSIDGTVYPNKSYSVETGKLSQYFENLFRLHDKREYSSNDEYSFIFSTHWVDVVSEDYLVGRPEITPILVWAYRNQSFPNEINVSEIFNRFLEDYHVSKDVAEQLFKISFTEQLEFEDNQYSDSDLLLQLGGSEASGKTTLKMDRTFAVANSGDLSRGPYFQPLYAALQTLKCLTIYPFNIHDYYDIDSGNNYKGHNGGIDDDSRQIIYYGAPGTGKSKTIKNNTEQAEKEGRVFRTTFHPDSDYSTFVGCYKPGMKSADRICSAEELAVKLKEIKNSGVTYPCHKFAALYWRSLKDLSADTIKQILIACGFTETMNVEIPKGVAIGQEYLNKDEDGKIIYTFTPQAFTNAYVKAWNAKEDVYLIIEEINRGNCAQIFGDLFQLLDRGNDGHSEYPIDADSDLANYIGKELAGSTRDDFPEGVKEGKKLVLPSNLYIWATMNTSDQSLFPIDSAFKRRWDWKYIKITEGKDKDTKKSLGWKILVDDIQDDKVRIYDWWEFLRRMNDVIYGATESADKQMGYFFAKAIDKFKGTKVGEINKEGENIEKEQVDLQADYITADTFVNKVMFYLWTDVMKDNEYSEIIELMKKDGKQLKFTDFFDESGDEVNHEALRSFLDNVMKDADKKCDVCNTELVQSLGVGMGTGFKPHSVIFKINEMVDDPYERVKGMWRMSEARADKDITKYVYGYATPEKKIVACYEVTEWKKVTDENGKPRFSFDGTPIKDDPMIGQPVEQIAHARGGVVFYTDNWEKK